MKHLLEFVKGKDIKTVNIDISKDFLKYARDAVSARDIHAFYEWISDEFDEVRPAYEHDNNDLVVRLNDEVDFRRAETQFISIYADGSVYAFNLENSNTKWEIPFLHVNRKTDNEFSLWHITGRDDLAYYELTQR